MRASRCGARIALLCRLISEIFFTMNLDYASHNIYVMSMNARELKRWLAAKGCTFANHAGGSGHLTVRPGGRVSQLPMHGKSKDLGTGLVRKILKDLGLKD